MRLTSKEFSDRYKISVSYLSRIENGNTPVNLKTLLQCCNAYITDIHGCENYNIDYERIMNMQFNVFASTLTSSEQRMMLRILKHIEAIKKEG